MPQFAQTSPSLNSITSTNTFKEATEEHVPELDPEVASKINMQCKNILQEYEQMHNLDVCIEL